MSTECTGPPPTPDEMVEILLRTDDVFKKFFTDSRTPQNVLEGEEQHAEKIFKATFPHYHMKEFQLFYLTYLKDKNLSDMNIQDESLESNEICNKLAYDPRKGGFIRMPRVNTYGRGKREKFNLGEFLRTKRDNGDYFQLSVGDREMVEDLLDELNEDKARNDQKADVALNRMVEMTAVLNGNCNYKILELHSERRIQ